MRQTCIGKRILKVTVLLSIPITVQPHCLLFLQDPFKNASLLIVKLCINFIW